MSRPGLVTRGAKITVKQAYAVYRLALWLQVCVVVSVLSVGCSTAVQHQPNEGIVDTLGVAQAKQRLQEIVTRSINSQVTDDFLQYRFRQAIAGFPTGAILENRMHFLNVGRMEVFENNLVIVRTAGDIVLAQFVFGNTPDAKMFADLLASFRARRSRGR
jgi:hypothetical protein